LATLGVISGRLGEGKFIHVSRSVGDFVRRNVKARQRADQERQLFLFLNVRGSEFGSKEQPHPVRKFIKLEIDPEASRQVCRGAASPNTTETSPTLFDSLPVPYPGMTCSEYDKYLVIYIVQIYLLGYLF
jgi:hypothetical protein